MLPLSASVKGGEWLVKNGFTIVNEDVHIDIPRRGQENRVAIIDAGDLPRADFWGGTWYWYDGRILGRWKRDDGWAQEYLHRWLLQPPPGKVVIHKNDQHWDCRRNNLLVIDDRFKTQHRRRPNSNGENEDLNVYWIEDKQCWRVWVQSGNQHRSAYFPKDQYEAAVAQANAFRRELLKYSKEALENDGDPGL